MNHTRTLSVPCVVWLALLAGPHPAVAQEPELRVQMKTYQLALLYRGPQAGQSTADAEQIQAQHRASMIELHKAGKLVGAGPITDAGDLRGVFILDVPSADEAEAIAAADPAVKAGRLRALVLSWYGPKGIGEAYDAVRRANPDAPDEMRTYQFGFLMRGPAWTREQTPAVLEVLQGHMAHLNAMGRAGQLKAAGPLSGDDRFAGVLVFQVASVEEAVRLASDDPGVKSGRFTVELHPWLAAAGVIPE
jgi:uncharacterized protein YciI